MHHSIQTTCAKWPSIFFPLHPKAHVLWYSWAMVNVIIPSVNHQSPKNWVMNLRCFLLHFLTLLQINHSFLLSSLIHITHLFLNITKEDDLDHEVRGGEPASKLSIWEISWEVTHKGHPKRGARLRGGVRVGGWGGKSSPLQLVAALPLVAVSFHVLLCSPLWGEGSSKPWYKKSAL